MIKDEVIQGKSKLDKETLTKNLIVGLGNILLADEGIGVHIVRKLQQSNLYLQTHYLVAPA